MSKNTRNQVVGKFFSFDSVDWSQPVAYSMGHVGQVYLNVAGREPASIVTRENYEQTQAKVVAALRELKDEEGHSLVSQIIARKETYHGPYEVGTLALLQNVSVERDESNLEVTVLWQTQQNAETAYTAFVHLLDPDGKIVDQVDRPLSPPTTSWVPQQVITESYSLAIPPGAGEFRIALGLYDASSGVGLPLYERGNRLADDRYLVPVPER